jgi:hypothetical protein
MASSIGMAGVMQRFAIVMRKLFAAFALVLITGVFPVMASGGLCTARPCCRGDQSGAKEISTLPGCCNETNCSQAVPGESELTQQTKRVFTEQAVAVVVDIVRLPPATVIVRNLDRFALGSPPTRQRLATLSLLLI